MARPITTATDWNAMPRRLHGAFQLWSGYPAELAPDLILCPLLYGARPEKSSSRSVCTMKPRGFVLLHARDADHLALLRQHVLPRLRHISFAYVLDATTGTVYPAHHDVVTLRQQDLAPLIVRLVAGFDGGATDLDALLEAQQRAFASLATAEEIVTFEAEPAVQQRRRDLAERVERAPIRLWEAMLWRGFHHRWELVLGEVPLVADLWSELGANRTLVQCVADAEHAFGRGIEEREGWLACGPFRLRQRGTRVELRYRPTGADRRAAFAPRAAAADEDQLPSLFGALLAGGGKGKSELIDGYTDSVIEVSAGRAPSSVAQHLAAEIRRVVGSPVVVAGPDDHDPGLRDVPAPPGAWRVRHWGRWVAVDMPMERAERIAWEALSGGGVADSFLAWRWAHGKDCPATANPTLLRAKRP